MFWSCKWKIAETPTHLYHTEDGVKADTYANCLEAGIENLLRPQNTHISWEDGVEADTKY